MGVNSPMRSEGRGENSTTRVLHVTRILGQIGVSIDLPGVHPSYSYYWLRRNAEAHMLRGERGMLLLVTLRGLRPPHCRPRGEGPLLREGKQEHRILPDGCRLAQSEQSARGPGGCADSRGGPETRLPGRPYALR